MNCPNCGKPTRPGAAFCGECGTRLSVVPAIESTLVEAPVAEKPLRRPPPPPVAETPTVSAVAEVPVMPQAITSAPIPDVAPVIIAPPPPPANAPRDVEVVAFGTTEEVTPRAESGAPTITITSPPPGISDPPSAVAPSSPGHVVPEIVAPSVESMDETRVSVRRRGGVHWRLVLPDGRQIEVPAALLVGRDPAVNAKWPAAVLLAIDDEAHSMSKTHAVFESDAGGLWVTDLDSTNGVVITNADGAELDIDSNVRTPIQPGSDVELGDYILQVERD
jgi:Double zinc ribbon/FHA domain